MATGKRRYGVACCTLAGLVVAAMSWAASYNPGKNGSLARTQAEAKILCVLKELYENDRLGMWNVTPEDGKLLRVLTEAVGAKNVVEVGTSNGYSAIWFCLALRNTGGKLTTHEIDTGRIAMARENFKRAGVSDMVTLVEGDAHQTVTRLKEPIDILFLDADKAGYLDYLNKLLPLVRPGGLILAHNTSWKPFFCTSTTWASA